MRKEIFSVQYLRGIAALLVVLVHVLQEVGNHTSNSFLLNFYHFKELGFIGVDVFFVISGFIMMYIHGNDFQKKNISLNFLKKRIVRVVPLYWILTSVTAFLLFFYPSIFGGGKVFDAHHVFASYIFIPAYNSIGLPLPILGPGWSLNYEFYFYVLFSIFLLFPKRYFVPSLTVLFLFSCLSGFIVNDNPILWMVTNPILFEFLFGIYIANLFSKGKLKNYIIPLAFGVALVLINIYIRFDMQYRLFSYGVTSALLLMGVLAYENKIGIRNPNKFLLFLANISYSLYLSHVFSYKIILKLIPSNIITSFPDTIAILVIIFSVVIAYIIYVLIEKPVNKILKKVLFKPKGEKLKSDKVRYEVIS